MTIWRHRKTTRFGAAITLGTAAFLAGATALNAQTAGQPATTTVTPSRAAERAWMMDARFGLFIHFGLYSIPGGVWDGRPMGRNDYAEWIRYQWDWPGGKGIPQAQYDTLLNRFDPADFDADRIAELAAAAGMKYVVITSKHHDGFALWPSKVGNYDITRTPFAQRHRDILGELVAACRKRGLKVGFYYSHWQDWHEPGGALPPWGAEQGEPDIQQPTDAAFDAYWHGKALPQVAELLERYQPDMLWFDTWGDAARDQITLARRDELIALVRSKSPATLINGRIAAHAPAGADFVSMDDNQFPTSDAPDVPWETPATMARSWGYSTVDHGWESSATLLRRRVDTLSRGGALTLNIGPMGDGTIPSPALRRLRELAAWEEVNREAVEGAQPWFERLPKLDYAMTWRREGANDVLYATLFAPTDRIQIALPPSLADGSPTSSRIIETGQDVPIQIHGRVLRLQLPAETMRVETPVVRIVIAARTP